jgi:hypothetical protein
MNVTELTIQSGPQPPIHSPSWHTLREANYKKGGADPQSPPEWGNSGGYCGSTFLKSVPFIYDIFPALLSWLSYGVMHGQNRLAHAREQDARTVANSCDNRCKR